MRERIVKYRRFTIRESFESKNGTGRTCRTTQGWTIDQLHARWNSTLKGAYKDVDHAYDQAARGIDSTGSRAAATAMLAELSAHREKDPHCTCSDCQLAAELQGIEEQES